MTKFLRFVLGFVLKGCAQHDDLIAETWILKEKEVYLIFTAAANESRSITLWMFRIRVCPMLFQRIFFTFDINPSLCLLSLSLLYNLENILILPPKT